MWLGLLLQSAVRAAAAKCGAGCCCQTWHRLLLRNAVRLASNNAPACAGPLDRHVAGVFAPLQQAVELLGISIDPDAQLQVFSVCVRGAKAAKDWHMRHAAVQAMGRMALAVQVGVGVRAEEECVGYCAACTRLSVGGCARACVHVHARACLHVFCVCGCVGMWVCVGVCSSLCRRWRVASGALKYKKGLGFSLPSIPTHYCCLARSLTRLPIPGLPAARTQAHACCGVACCKAAPACCWSGSLSLSLQRLCCSARETPPPSLLPCHLLRAIGAPLLRAIGATYCVP